MKVRPMVASGWPAVKEIYEKGIATGNATFQTTAPPWDDWDKSHLSACRLVLEEEENILGWAALSQVSSRFVYAGVAEVSVYINSALSVKAMALFYFRN